MSLSQLPKSLQKKRIIDIILFNCDDYLDAGIKQ